MRNGTTRTSLAWIAVLAAFSLGFAAGKGDAVRRLNLPGRSDDRPYSHLVEAGKTLYVAGSIGLDPATGKVPEDAMAEARMALDSVKSKLALAGATMDDLVSVQVFCSDLSLYDQFNELYASYFRGGAPARAFVGSGPLLFGARFEINGIAVLR